MMRVLLFVASLTAFQAALGANVVTPPDKQRPGFGVVKSVTPVPTATTAAPTAATARSKEESASSGSSAPAASHTTYLVTVRMDDGSYQIRQLKKPVVGVGKRVLITNAGDVVPE
jgi:hypothetical protein